MNSKSWNWKDLVVSSFEVSVVDAIAKHLKCLNLCYRKSLESKGFEKKGDREMEIITYFS